MRKTLWYAQNGLPQQARPPRRSIFKQWKWTALDDHHVQQHGFPEAPILRCREPIVYSAASTETVFTTTPSSTAPPNWHPKTSQNKCTAYCLERWPGLWDPDKRELTMRSRVEHEINTRTAELIRQSFRTYSPPQRLAIQYFLAVDRCLKDRPNGVVPEETASANAPVVWRICYDYGALIKAVKKTVTRLLNVELEIQRAAGRCWYAFLDFEHGFWQIVMREKDRGKTAFIPFFMTFSSA